MVKEVVNLRWVHFSVKGMLGENVRKLLDVVSSKNTYYILTYEARVCNFYEKQPSQMTKLS